MPSKPNTTVLILNETFERFRYRCGLRKYYQRYTNDEVVDGGKTLGKYGIDFGPVKCVHSETATGRCREDNTAESCPRLKMYEIAAV